MSHARGRNTGRRGQYTAFQAEVNLRNLTHSFHAQRAIDHANVTIYLPLP